MVGKEITKGNIDGQILVPHSPFHQQGLKKVLKMGRKGLKMDRKGLKMGQKIPIFFKNRNGGNRGTPPHACIGCHWSLQILVSAL